VRVIESRTTGRNSQNNKIDLSMHRDSTVKHAIDLPLKLHREIERGIVKSEFW